MSADDVSDDGGTPGPGGADAPASARRRTTARAAADVGSRKTGARRPAASQDPAPALMEPVAAPDDGTADGDAPEDGAAAGAYKTRDLVDRVAKVAGVKRRVAKPLVEAVLTELSAALHGGRTLSLRPLGKVTVSRMREDGGGHVLVCRIRQRGPGAAATKSDETPDPALAAVDKGR